MYMAVDQAVDSNIVQAVRPYLFEKLLLEFFKEKLGSVGRKKKTKKNKKRSYLNSKRVIPLLTTNCTRVHNNSSFLPYNR